MSVQGIMSGSTHNYLHGLLVSLYILPHGRDSCSTAVKKS